MPVLIKVLPVPDPITVEANSTIPKTNAQVIFYTEARAHMKRTGLNTLYISSDVQLELISDNNVNLKTNFSIPKQRTT